MSKDPNDAPFRDPPGCSLSNGLYTVRITAAGTGYSSWNGLALTGRSDDPIEDRSGLFVYLRDLDDGRLWSIGREPAGAGAERYEASAGGGVLEIRRADGGIDARMRVFVVPDAGAEIRLVALRNRSEHERRIELTTYTEIVLHDPEAHAAHPAFSKLFVQTEVLRGVLLARRRPRGDGERVAWMVHALGGPGRPRWETDRSRFLGRGRGPDAPRAFDRGHRPSGTVGNVLDPVFSLRRTVRLAPGAETELVVLLGAATTRDEALALARRFRRRSAVERALRHAAATNDAGPAAGDRDAQALPLPPGEGWGEGIKASPAAHRAAGDREDLLFFNGHGGFTRDGGEYVIRIDPTGRSAHSRPPMPWINVVANESFGFLVSESGAGYTWSRNSRQNRITPWSNDPIADPHGEALYVREEETGAHWSPTPGPCPAAGAYEVRHGFGYTRWRHESHGLEQETITFVARGDPVRITRLRLGNASDRPRRLSVFRYDRLVLGVLPRDARSVVTAGDGDVIFATNPGNGEFADGVVFAAAPVPPAARVRFTADRRAFLGDGGRAARPAAVVERADLDGATGTGLDPCAALQVTVELAPRASTDVVFLLGETTSRAGAREIVARHGGGAAAERALGETRAFWTQTLSAVRVRTPRPAIDLMLNGWLAYQNLSCRLWGRSAFYQSGGAFGFRDQLQDAAALVHLRPDLTRSQILLHAAHQFAEGDVLHWWHPPHGRGIRTRFSDDLLWLPYVVADYVRATGDRGVLDERVDFVRARPLKPGEDEATLVPEPGAAPADLYEHCRRALDRSLTEGAHGLPLMGTGDWNDGMNRVGREGRGESVWMGFFLYAILGDFVPLCAERGDTERVRRYGAYRERLREALNGAGWDGAWYRRAYYDDGTPLGSADSDECRIDALAQAWAVISRAAPPDRAAQAMDAVERELVSADDGLIRLLWPPFDRTAHDPGYIKGYVPGIRENGGQYTHAALWVVRALAEIGRRDRAAELLERVGPVWHARDAATVSVYQVEPYVVAADVYGTPPHVGRGGWTWYTGSAGWMYRVGLESILGVSLEGGDTLCLRPRIPDHWPELRIDYRLTDGRTRYRIEVTNPDGAAAAVASVTVDGRPGEVRDGAARIRLARDGGVHTVRVALGGT